MKFFGYITLTALVLSSLACREARLPTTAARNGNQKVVDRATDMKPTIVGSWQQVEVSEKGQVTLPDAEGFIAGEKIFGVIDSEKMTSITVKKGSADIEVTTKEYKLEGDNVVAGDASAKIVSLTGNELVVESKDGKTMKYKRVSPDQVPAVTASAKPEAGKPEEKKESLSDNLAALNGKTSVLFDNKEATTCTAQLTVKDEHNVTVEFAQDCLPVLGQMPEEYICSEETMSCASAAGDFQKSFSVAHQIMVFKGGTADHPVDFIFNPR